MDKSIRYRILENLFANHIFINFFYQPRLSKYFNRIKAMIKDNCNEKIVFLVPYLQPYPFGEKEIEIIIQ